MSFRITRSQIYDFMEFMTNDMEGKIGIVCEKYEYVINLFLQRDPRAIMYYNMYNTYFENNKKYLKKENIKCYQFAEFDNIDSLIDSSQRMPRNIEPTQKNKMYVFCRDLWLYMHH